MLGATFTRRAATATRAALHSSAPRSAKLGLEGLASKVWIQREGSISPALCVLTLAPLSGIAIDGPERRARAHPPRPQRAAVEGGWRDHHRRHAPQGRRADDEVPARSEGRGERAQFSGVFVASRRVLGWLRSWRGGAPPQSDLSSEGPEIRVLGRVSPRPAVARVARHWDAVRIAVAHTHSSEPYARVPIGARLHPIQPLSR